MKANNEMIQWSRAQYWDKAWNPYIGCVPRSPACVNCYARALAKRFKMPFTPHRSAQYKAMPRWKNKVVFCGNMTDLWGTWVQPWEQRAMILDAIENNRGNSYLWLTKRHDRLIEMLMSDDFLTGAMNHTVTYDELNAVDQYFGVTAEDYEHFMLRVPPLQEVAEDDLFNLRPWISFEPLLGRVPVGGLNLEEFRWFVVGCESGPNRRPCKIEWVEEIVELAKAFKVPVFVKQLDINGKCVTDITKFPKHLQIRQVPWYKGKEA